MHNARSGIRRERVASQDADHQRASAGAAQRVDGLQARAGNRVTRAVVTGRGAVPGTRVLRALAGAKTAEPAYADGLSLATIVSTALDKPPRPKMDGTSWDGKANKQARKTLRTVFGDDQTTWNLDDVRFLQVGQVHGNQTYENKSGDLPGDETLVEYDIAKYTGDPKARGGQRVVTGTKDATTKYYFTGDHYSNFAEYDPV